MVTSPAVSPPTRWALSVPRAVMPPTSPLGTPYTGTVSPQGCGAGPCWPVSLMEVRTLLFKIKLYYWPFILFVYQTFLYPCQELWVICYITHIDSDVCTVFVGSPGMMSGAQSGGGSSGSSVNSSAITAGAVIGAVLIVIIVVGAFLYTKRQ